MQCVKGDRETHKEVWEPRVDLCPCRGCRGSLAEEAPSVLKFDRWRM